MTGTEPAHRSFPSIAQSLALAAIMVCCMIVSIPALLFAGAIGEEPASLLYYLCAMVPPLVVADRWRKWRTGVSSYRFALVSPTSIAALAAGAWALTFGVVGPLIAYTPGPDWLLEAIESAIGTGWAAFATVVIAAPILEELFFRGVMLDGLLRRHSATTSVLVSSVLFGAIHLNPWQFVTALVIGAFAGWVYVRTRSVGNCIVIHAAVNALGFTTGALNFEDPGPVTRILFATEGLELLILVAGSGVVFLAAFQVLRSEFRERHPV